MTRKRILIIILVIALLAGGIAFALRKDKADDDPSKQSQLTGLDISDEEAERPVLGVMIENSEEARPQTGLSTAGIVFEATTEGGITRYLALYQENLPEEIGPVRSLRMHYLDWAMGFDASIAHVGGSAEALDEADDRDAKSLSQFKYDEPYFRDDSRQAPHNMYVRTSDLLDLQKDLEHGKSKFEDIPRSPDAPSQSPTATSIRINYSSPPFLAEFRYDPTTNRYGRFLAGDPHADNANGQAITVKNLVVLMVEERSSPNDGATGSGDAVLFKDGLAMQARWRQSSFKNRIEILDSQGNEVPLNRGNTWFAALTEGRPLSY